LFELRTNIEKQINRYCTFVDATIVNAMVIGKRSYLSRGLKELFIKTGTAHILSVSGLHVAMISAMLFFVFRFLRLPPKVSSILVLIFLVAYTIVAGTRPPIIRAVIMISIYLLGYILERDFDIYSALSLAGIIILLYNPLQLFSAGFVLSFACVFSICYIAPRLLAKIYLAGESASKKIFFWLKQSASVSLAVYIGVMPIIAYYFHIISPVTILANIFVVPLLSVILFLSILYILLAWVSPIVGGLLSICIHLPIAILLKGLTFLEKVPFGNFKIPNISIAVVACYYAVFFLFLERKKIASYGFHFKAKY